MNAVFVYLITFRSVTYAQRGERVLSRAGERCALQRTPRWMEEQGCGYALRIWVRDMDAVLEIMREDNIPLRRIYLQGQDGVLEEVTV